LAQANEEAARILQQARSKGEEMLDQDVSVQAAQNRAANIVEEARQVAQRIRDEADGYVLDVLSRLEQDLQKNLNTVRNGINAVNQPTASAQMPPSPIIEEDEDIDAEALTFPQVNMREEVDSAPTRGGGFNISLRRGKNDEE
jgi:vacuolar-type H+-ATPase subunit H